MQRAAMQQSDINRPRAHVTGRIAQGFTSFPAVHFMVTLVRGYCLMSWSLHDALLRSGQTRWTTLFYVMLTLASHTPCSGSIPRIIHQMHLMGSQAMQQDVKDGRFMDAWWRSCKAFHHGWRYMWWDLAAGERLLAERYPWFLPLFRHMENVVMLSDALRPFILHAYGGIYLDLDTECYGSLWPSLRGNSLVLPSEEEGKVNNAQARAESPSQVYVRRVVRRGLQMASVLGHPFWELMMQHAAEVAQRGDVNHPGPETVLEASGPLALTRLFKEYLQSHSVTPTRTLAGTYPDPAVAHRTQHRPTSSRSLTIRVQPKGDWFTPCSYNDTQCQTEVARCVPVVRALRLCAWAEQLWPLEGWTQCDGGARRLQLWQLCWWQRDPSKVQDVLPGEVRACVEQFGQLYGLHHYSNTWLGANGTKHQLVLRESVHSALEHLWTEPAFVEASPLCTHPAPNTTALALEQPLVAPLTTQTGSATDTAEDTAADAAAGTAAGAATGAAPLESGQPAWGVFLGSALRPLQDMHRVQPFRLAPPPYQVLSVSLLYCRSHEPGQQPRCCRSAEPQGRLLARLRQLHERVTLHGGRLHIATDMDPDAVRHALDGGSIDNSPSQTVNIIPVAAGTQHTLLDQLQAWPSIGLTVLHVSMPGLCGWRELSQIAAVKERMQVMQALHPFLLLLELGGVDDAQPIEASMVQRVFSMTLQEQRFLGLAHHAVNSTQVRSDGAEHQDQYTDRKCAQRCDDAHAEGGLARKPSLWLAFVRRVMLVETKRSGVSTARHDYSA